MLSRRKLIIGVSAGVILPPKLVRAQIRERRVFATPRTTLGLAFPAGRMPGVNPNHPANQGLYFSGRGRNPSPGVQCINYSGVSINTNMVSVPDGLIGPCISSNTTGSTNVCTFPSNSSNATVPAAVTLAVMATQLTNNGATQVFMSTSGVAAHGHNIDIQFNTANLTYANQNGGVTLTGVPAFSASKHYFAIVCAIAGSSVNWGITQLETGQVFTGSQATSPGAFVADSTGPYNFCNNRIPNAGSAAQISHWVYSAALLSTQQIAQICRDPWSIWYP